MAVEFVNQNPKFQANPEQEAFAMEQLRRLFGDVGTPYDVKPTYGPYDWAPQREVNYQTTAMDGSKLGGINLGMVNDIYQQNAGNKAMADARMYEILGSRFGWSGNPYAAAGVQPTAASQPAPPPVVKTPAATGGGAPPAATQKVGMTPLDPGFFNGGPPVVKDPYNTKDSDEYLTKQPPGSEPVTPQGPNAGTGGAPPVKTTITTEPVGGGRGGGSDRGGRGSQAAAPAAGGGGQRPLALPQEFADIVGGQQQQPMAMGFGGANPPVPTQSAFAPPMGQDTGMGANQLSSIVNWMNQQRRPQR
ncbi:MAG TPA: hypothetical protein VF077_00360 [Nitrospiraceae bacterium]